jgi:hypothetical protein
MELFETGWQGVDVMRRCIFIANWSILSLKYSFRAFVVLLLRPKSSDMFYGNLIFYAACRIFCQM